jgi:hypothetical protein
MAEENEGNQKKKIAKKVVFLQSKALQKVNQYTQ